jgi:RNA polymerase sigma factor (sigma-70 family)
MITPPTDHQLDPKNWVKAYADYLYMYAITRINDEEQAQDLVQETFLAGLQAMGRFAGKSSERTWLTAILKNKIIDVYRKRSSGLRTQELTHAEGEMVDFFDAARRALERAACPAAIRRRRLRPAGGKRIQQHIKNVHGKTTRPLAICFYHEAPGR